MTNEEQIQDLKQFIEATVSQQASSLAIKDDIQQLDAKIDKVHKELKSDIKALDEKLDTIQDAIADTFTHANEVTNASIDGVETSLKDHEQRLQRLEQRAA